MKTAGRRSIRPARSFSTIGLALVLLAGASEGRRLHDPPCDGEPWESGPIAPIGAPARLDDPIVRLGRLLFHAPELSRDGSVSCASCHRLESGGDDGLPRSRGVDGREGRVNAPSVLNRVFDFRQFWDGRSESLASQIDGPLHDPREMDSSWPLAISQLRAREDFLTAFRAAFPGAEPSSGNLRGAIAAYEAQLTTPNAPFDRYLCGDADAMSSEALEGYRLFSELGCVACHQGRNVGGNMFQRFGIMGDYFEDRGGTTEADLGRFVVTGRAEDRNVFKVPSLRNVALTAPYLHDGSQSDLAGAIRVMARYQLGRAVSEHEVEALVAFLESLTGVLPREALP